MMRKSFLYLLPFSFADIYCEGKLPLQQFELYWRYYDIWSNLDHWAQSFNLSHRRNIRRYIADKKYKTVLDVPCGVCTEYFGYQNDKINMEYYGLDITEKFVNYARKRGILNVALGSIEAIPYPDSTFDVCFAQDILEHLSYYEKAVNELIRTARQEVIIVFFIDPNYEKENIKPDQYELAQLFNNRYNTNKFEQFVLSNPKVKKLQWQWHGENKPRLTAHIYVNA
jgi:ubiquinone/menaquinone biosynthesis C-methylase UbiE